MKASLLIGALVVAVYFVSSADDTKAKISLTTSVATPKLDLVRVASPDSNIEIFVDRNSVVEFADEDTKIRTAQVVYHLEKPMIVKGKEVYWVYNETAYECKDKMFMTTTMVLYGKNIEDPLFKSSGDGDVKVAQSDTVVEAELEYVCNQKIKKTPPKSEPEAVKSKKYIDI